MGHKHKDGIRITAGFFYEKPILELRKYENGSTSLIIYMKMRLYALDYDDRIIYDGIGDNFASELAMVLKESVEDVSKTIDRLIAVGLAKFESCDVLKILKPSHNRDRGTPEYRAWRKAVYQRDNYTCQMCNERGIPIEAHHINPWALSPQLRYDVNNGITLCKECHRRAHGRFNTNKESNIYFDMPANGGE